MSCNSVRSQLPQYIADGEPALVIYAGIHAHLATCASCQAYAARLRVVEAALHAYPPVCAPAYLPTSVVGAISHESQAKPEEWQLLPWDVWVPAAAFALAILVAIMSIPPHLVTVPSAQEINGVIQQWPAAINNWLGNVQLMTRENLFWAIWTGIFATTAGLGLSLSLIYFHTVSKRRLDDWEMRVTDTATRLIDRAHRVH